MVVGSFWNGLTRFKMVSGWCLHGFKTVWDASRRLRMVFRMVEDGLGWVLGWFKTVSGWF